MFSDNKEVLYKITFLTVNIDPEKKRVWEARRKRGGNFFQSKESNMINLCMIHFTLVP